MAMSKIKVAKYKKNNLGKAKTSKPKILKIIGKKINNIPTIFLIKLFETINILKTYLVAPLYAIALTMSHCEAVFGLFL